MLTRNQIANNKERFLSIIEQVDLPMDKEGLVKFLTDSDFFEAPASTVYHNCFSGGLCAHSLNVYDNLCKLVDMYSPNTYSNDSLAIVALLHDLGKVNFYEKAIRNVKVYSDKGKRSDEMGSYDWKAEESWKVRDVEDRFTVGTHGENSYFQIKRFVPLNLDESIAIIHHHAGMDKESEIRDMSAILKKSTLLTLLHIADMLATYVIENE